MFLSEQHSRFSPEVGPNLGANILFLFKNENFFDSLLYDKNQIKLCTFFFATDLLRLFALLESQISQILSVTTAYYAANFFTYYLSSKRSGRLFLVCSNALSSRHWSILAKLPLVNTSGTFHPL